MDREGIRRLAAETLHLPTSNYQFVDDEVSFKKAALAIGFPCIVKPVMSSSGKGQSVIRNENDPPKFSTTLLAICCALASAISLIF